MFKFFRKIDIMSSIAQLLVVVLLLPFIAILIRLIMPDTIGNFITGILGEIPVISVGSDLFENFSNSQSINVFDYFNTIIDVAGKNMIEMTIIGLCVYDSRRLFSLIGIKGLPIISTVVGVFVGCFCLRWINSEEMYMYMLAVLLIITAGVVIFVVKGHFFKWFWDFGLGTGMAVITATATSGFLSVLSLMIKGGFDTFWVGFEAMLLTLFPMVLCLVVDLIFFGSTKTD